jgi:hypothetical protein
MEVVYDLFVHHLLYCMRDLQTAIPILIRLLPIGALGACIKLEEYLMPLFMKDSSESTHSIDEKLFCHYLRYVY